MAVYCWRCGAPNADHADLCVKCGEPIRTPSPQGLDNPHPETIANTFSGQMVDITCPSCSGTIPIGSIACPCCGYTASKAWTAPGTDQSAEDAPTKPSRKWQQWLAISAVPIVMIVAVIAGFILRSPSSVGEAGIATSEPPYPIPSVQSTEVYPSSLPTPVGSTSLPTTSSGCYTTDPMATNSDDGFILGQDHFAAPSNVTSLGPFQVCTETTPTHVQAVYQVGANDLIDITSSYSIYLQRNSGFTGYQVTPTTGQFWRRSVDSGKWLYVQMSSTTDQVTVTIDKGGRDVVPADIISATSDSPATVTYMGNLNVRESLLFTPATGWQQYPFYLPGWGSSFLPENLRYNKVSDQSFEGTFTAYAVDMRYENDSSSLQIASTNWLRSFNPDGQLAISSGTQITVGGRPAMKYTRSIDDSTITYIYIQGNTAIFALVAEVDSSMPGAAQDVNSMIDSVQLQVL